MKSTTPESDQSFDRLLMATLRATDCTSAAVFLLQEGRYQRIAAAGLYDVLSVDPSLAAHQVNQKQVRLAMAIGDKRHYRISDIAPRHFLQSAIRADYDDREMMRIFGELRGQGEAALERAAATMPKDSPDAVVSPIAEAFLSRLRLIDLL